MSGSNAKAARRKRPPTPTRDVRGRGLVMQLPVGEIIAADDTQMRERLDPKTVAEYAEAMTEGDGDFPPVEVFEVEGRYYLTDGFHRLVATKKAGLGTIEAEVWTATIEDAVWWAAAANARHGLRRSNADKAKAVRAALRSPLAAGLSDGHLAMHVGVSAEMVRKYRAEVEPTSKNWESQERVGLDGRKLNVANIGRRTERGTGGGTSPADDPVAVRLAAEFGVTPGEVMQAADYAEAVDRLDEIGVVSKAVALSGRAQLASDVRMFVRWVEATYPDRGEVMSRLLGELWEEAERQAVVAGEVSR